MIDMDGNFETVADIPPGVHAVYDDDGDLWVRADDDSEDAGQWIDFWSNEVYPHPFPAPLRRRALGLVGKGRNPM